MRILLDIERAIVLLLFCTCSCSCSCVSLSETVFNEPVKKELDSYIGDVKYLGGIQEGGLSFRDFVSIIVKPIDDNNLLLSFYPSLYYAEEENNHYYFRYKDLIVHLSFLGVDSSHVIKRFGNLLDEEELFNTLDKIDCFLIRRDSERTFIYDLQKKLLFLKERKVGRYEKYKEYYMFWKSLESQRFVSKKKRSLFISQYEDYQRDTLNHFFEMYELGEALLEKLDYPEYYCTTKKSAVQSVYGNFQIE